MFSPAHNQTPLRIAGFGACMISGYHHKGGGLFEVACKEIARDTEIPIESKGFSFGGFPAPRARKYLKSKVFGYRPRYIVIQLAALDALCPIRNDAVKKHGPTSSQLKRASWSSHLRWMIAALLGYVRGLEPVTPLSEYIPAIEGIIEACIAADMVPIVLTPFVYGSRYSMRNALIYAEVLRGLVAAKPGAHLVDCIEALRPYQKSQVLQHDGFHLSQAGHAIVGTAIAKCIATDICASDGRGRAPAE
jgi:hypothetical protein